MKNAIRILLPLAALFVIGLQNCQLPTEGTANTVVSPPLEGVDVEYQALSLDAEKGKTFKMDNGTSIVIPPNAFVDSDGNPIKGKVHLNYREFHNAADIIASGITMRYDSAGTNHFETAGMFEIRGFRKTASQAQIIGTPENSDPNVYIAENKSIEVNLASFAEGDDFNFYQLDEEQQNWTYQGASRAAVNEAKLALLEELAPVPAKPQEPKKANGDMIVLDLQFSTNSFPELADFEGILWEYVGDPEKLNMEEDGISFETFKNFSLLASNTQEGQYEIHVSDKGEKRVLEVAPVFSGVRNQEKAMEIFKKKQQAYEIALEKRRIEEERRQAEANLYRSFRINKFGIYNHDRLWSAETPIALNANFKVEGEELSKATIFLVSGEDGRAILQYRTNEWSRFRFDAEDTNRLLAILPNNAIATFSSDNFENLKVKNGENYTFQMSKEKGIESFDDIESVLARL